MTDVLTIDFETYYDPASGYTLSKMTGIEYVYDTRFEIIGVSIKRNGGDSQWHSGVGFDFYRDVLTRAGVQDAVCVMHNGSEFDALILSRLGVLPKQFVCTLQIARLLGYADLAGGSLAKLSGFFGIGAKGTEVLNAVGKRRADFSPGELARYGQYCDNDVDLTYALFLRMQDQVPAMEWGLMDLTTRMLARPLLQLDKPMLQDYLERLTDDRQALLDRVGMSESELQSNPKFALALEAVGAEVPMKISARTGKPTFAFAKSDAGFQALVDSEDDNVADLAAARLGIKSTIEHTRTKRLIDLHGLTGGVLPVPLRYSAAHTARWGGTMKINMQNLSARKRAPVLKRAMRAPPGYVVMSGDSSQIELRVNAWLWEQDDLLDTWRRERELMAKAWERDAAAEELENIKKMFDLYREFAADSVYHVPLAEVTKPQRTMAKSAVLGCGFMMGAARFKEYVRVETGMFITDEEAALVIQAYRLRFAAIANGWAICRRILEGLTTGQSFSFGRNNCLFADHEEKRIRLPSGRYLYYQGLHATQDETTGRTVFVYKRRKGRTEFLVRVHPGLLCENIVQAIARDIVGHQAIRVERLAPIVTLTHDEIVAIVPEVAATETTRKTRKIMSTPPSWAADLPVSCEVGFGPNYGDA